MKQPLEQILSIAQPTGDRSNANAVIDVNGTYEEKTTGLKILIVGAGIGGLTAAIALRKNGHEVLVILLFNHICFWKGNADAICRFSSKASLQASWELQFILHRMRMAF